MSYKTISAEVRTIDLEGSLLIVYEDTKQPILLRAPNEPDDESYYLLPVFDSSEKLLAAVPWMQIEGKWLIKKISGTKEFIESVRDSKANKDGKKFEIIVALNPYITDQKTTRWTGIFLPEEVKKK